MISQVEKEYKTDLLDLRLGDCMDLMRNAPDNHWDLAIVDPPYNLRRFQNDKPTSRLNKYGEMGKWNNEPLHADYWSHLFRVSKNQIVWGGNYFTLPKTQGWLVWNKHQPAPSFADGELAWTSFDKPLCILDLPYFGSHGADITRIHPTQKPVALYNWLLHNYAEPGDRILDTHLGSMSIAIACHYKGFHLTGTELDPDYFKSGVERIKRETAQTELFGTANTQEHQQGTQSGGSAG